MHKKQDIALTNFIYESGILSKTPRSGLWFLGTGSQSVAEHTLRTIFIGMVLCYLTPKANRDRVLFLSLFHDLGEGRTSDLNYVHQKYGRLAEAQAIDDLSKTLPFGKEIKEAYEEATAKQTLEAKLTKDADQLEWLATMREEEVKGNSKAKSWAKIAYERMKTPAGKKVGKFLLVVHPDGWWFDAKDEWFVDRKQKHKRWKK
jgi:putative hydrolase of HD superfamily